MASDHDLGPAGGAVDAETRASKSTGTIQPTPGPWHVGETHGWPAFVDVKARGLVVAMALVISADPNADPLTEARANAQLMAASPELLDAARAALAYDRAIYARGLAGSVETVAGLPGALATGIDLDELYFDWLTKAEAALVKAGVSVDTTPRQQLVPDLLDAVKGLLGLVQMITFRDDLPSDLAAELKDNHRYQDADALVARIEGGQ